LSAAVARRRAWTGCDCDPRSSGINAVCFDELKKSSTEFFIGGCACDLKTVNALTKPAEMSIKEDWRPVVNGQRVKDPVTEQKPVIVRKDRW
jgi:hypothetical protein